MSYPSLTIFHMIFLIGLKLPGSMEYIEQNTIRSSAWVVRKKNKSAGQGVKKTKNVTFNHDI
jgi:hypothetical protein